jgi:hypothetical protein
MPQSDDTGKVLEHIRYLSVIIGGRGSCTPPEKRAAEYAAGQMRRLGASDVRVEAFAGSPSTYWPYALAFGVAVLGSVLMWLIEGPWTLAAAALLNALGAWGILAESELAANWMRWVLPKADSHNAVGVISPTGQVRQRVVLCAHVDSHRTPFFFASNRRFALFLSLMIGAWVGMVVEAVIYGLSLAFAWDWAFWFGALSLLQVVALDICLHANGTPFSPGANDNASGVAVALELAKRLAKEPLAHTETWLAFTGCEETVAQGMAAFLDAHGAELGDDAVYIILDMVGQGRLGYVRSDGLFLKHRAHRRALELAGRANAALPGLEVEPHSGIAYTDATLATKRGRVALAINALPPRGQEKDARWHRMSDTPEHLDPQVLNDAQAFTWQMLQEIDKG